MSGPERRRYTQGITQRDPKRYANTALISYIVPCLHPPPRCNVTLQTLVECVMHAHFTRKCRHTEKKKHWKNHQQSWGIKKYKIPHSHTEFRDIRGFLCMKLVLRFVPASHPLCITNSKDGLETVKPTKSDAAGLCHFDLCPILLSTEVLKTSF